MWRSFQGGHRWQFTIMTVPSWTAGSSPETHRARRRCWSPSESWWFWKRGSSLPHWTEDQGKLEKTHRFLKMMSIERFVVPIKSLNLYVMQRQMITRWDYGPVHMTMVSGKMKNSGCVSAVRLHEDGICVLRKGNNTKTAQCKDLK